MEDAANLDEMLLWFSRPLSCPSQSPDWERNCLGNSVSSLLANLLFSHEGMKARRHEEIEEETLQTPAHRQTHADELGCVHASAFALPKNWICELQENEEREPLHLPFLRAFVPSCLRVNSPGPRARSDRERETDQHWSHSPFAPLRLCASSSVATN